MISVTAPLEEWKLIATTVEKVRDLVHRGKGAYLKNEGLECGEVYVAAMNDFLERLESAMNRKAKDDQERV